MGSSTIPPAAYTNLLSRALIFYKFTTHEHQELWDSEGFAKRFQQQVVGNLGDLVDEIVDDMSELVAQRARTQASVFFVHMG